MKGKILGAGLSVEKMGFAIITMKTSLKMPKKDKSLKIARWI